jgi:8-oxo-dGTP pyrophosphatase MutT (NUDIX family)
MSTKISQQINIKDENGLTRLHKSAIEGNNKLAKYLLDKGADLDLQDNEGWTALHHAIYKDPNPNVDTTGQFKVFVNLILKGANVNIQNKDGYTPLMFASMKKNSKVVKSLLKAGADDSLKNMEEKTVYDLSDKSIKKILTTKKEQKEEDKKEEDKKLEDKKEEDKKEEDKKEEDKKLEDKKAGLVVYTRDGFLLIVYQNVHKWSFPKGHFDKKLDKTILDTAIREFREETNYDGYINPSRLKNKMKTSRNTTLFLLEVTPEEVSDIKLIDGVDIINDEILQSTWIHINDFEYFRNTYHVNNTISKFNIAHFLTLSNLDSNTLSFKLRKSSKASRKSSKASRKSSKASRKSSKASRKSSKASRKSSKASRKSSKAPRKSSKAPRKSSKAPRKSSKASRKSSKAPRKSDFK